MFSLDPDPVLITIYLLFLQKFSVGMPNYMIECYLEFKIDNLQDLHELSGLKTTEEIFVDATGVMVEGQTHCHRLLREDVAYRGASHLK